MRLINVDTLELQDFLGNDMPEYAILSHTWEDEEVTYQDMHPLTPDTRSKKGFAKIRETCRLADSRGFEYAWVDTCCIDKSSSAELTEAINSMYRWYREATVCYAYLSDVDDSADETALAASRWFTRGWTLQELIAPKAVIFWSRNWVEIDSKLNLCDSLHTITNIPADLLRGYSIASDYSIACRMSWAAGRETTRIEDTAYCLLGLFNINMALLYGEGSNAFYRLQQELVKSSTDASLFAWAAENTASYSRDLVGLFASHPKFFANSKDLPPLTDTIYESMNITNRGIALRVSLGVLPSPDSDHTYVLCLGTVPASSDGPADAESRTVCIYLRQTLPATFLRCHYGLLPIITPAPRRLSIELIYLTARITPSGIALPWQFPNEDKSRLCRISALQIETLPPGTRRAHVNPVSNFDVQDGVFFSTSHDPGGGGWALFGAKGIFTSPAGVKYPLDLMCYVFGWARAAGQIRWVLVNRRTEKHESLHPLQLDLMKRPFERDGDNIRRMLAKYGGWTSEVALEPDRLEPGGETADGMVARLAVKRVDVQTLSDDDKYHAPCAKNWTKVEVLVVPCE
jgi:hypothetical protein